MIGSCDYVVIILDLVVRHSTKNLSINIEGTGMAADVEIKTNFEFFFFLTKLTLKYHIELYDVNYTPG